MKINDAVKAGPEQVGEFPSIKVRNVDGQYVVRDGNSRLSIAQQTKAKQIKVKVETDYDSAVDLNRRTRRNNLPKTGTSDLPQPR